MGHMKKNIFLIGPMGAGKTTLGRQLARRLNMDFYDSDRIIEGSPKNAISVVVVTPWGSTASAGTPAPQAPTQSAQPAPAGPTVVSEPARDVASDPPRVPFGSISAN